MIIRISHSLFRWATVLVAAAILAIAALGVRLAVAPIQLAWLAPYLAQAIAPADRRVKVEIRDASVRLGQHRVIEMVGTGVQAIGPDGEVLIDLPEIQIGISLRALLLRGMLAPTSLEATAPVLILTRNEAGAIGLRGSRADRPEVTPGGQIDVSALLAPLLAGDSSHPWSYLERADISGGRLLLKDVATDHTIMARDAALTVRRLVDGVAADLVFALDQEGAPARVQSTVALDGVNGRARFAINVSNVSAAELVRLEPALALEGVSLVLSGRLLGDIDQEHGLSPLSFEVRATNGMIERPDWLAGPLPIDSLTVKGRLAPNLMGAEVTEARITTKGATVAGEAQIVWRDREITLRAEVRAQHIAAPDLALYWPPELGSEARTWVLANVIKGMVPAAQATISLKPGDLDRSPVPEGVIRGRFEFADATLRYFDTMPPLTRVDGSATFTARRMDFALTRGQVGAIRLESASAALTGIGIKGRDTTQLVVEATIDAPLDQALALLDHPPLGFARQLGVAPADASGQARAELTIGTPLHQDLDASELRVAVSAKLRDASIRGLPGQIDLSDGQFTLKIDNRGADLAGQGAVNQIPLAIEWRENFADHASFKRRYRIQGTLDVQALQRLGLVLPIPAEGASYLDATIVEAGRGREAELALDLGPLALDLPALGWQKPKGEPGRLTASVRMPTGGPVRVEAFELSSAGLETAGSLELSLEPVQIEQLTLSRFRVGRTDAALDLRHRAGRGYQVTVRGQSLDLAPVLKMRLSGGDAEGGAPTALELTLIADRVLFGALGMVEVDAHLVRNALGWQSIDMHGRLPKGGRVELTLVADGDQQRLKITSDDAGDLLQALDQTARIEGGQLEVKASIRRQVPALEASGEIRIEQFTLLEAPVLARVLTVASLTGVGNLLGGQGIHFDRLDLPFTFRRQVMLIDRGRLSGSQLGLTMRGRIDLARDRLDLDGTIVPFYGLNWALGQIPLVGAFFSGSDGEGAFAVTYSIDGPRAEPEISVNPLAMLAPGFIRDLFSGRFDEPIDGEPVPAP